MEMWHRGLYEELNWKTGFFCDMKEAKSHLERVTGVKALLRIDCRQWLRPREVGISFPLFPPALYLCCPCATSAYV